MVPRMVCKGLQPLVRGQIRPTFTTEVQLHSLKQRREILLVAQKQSLKGLLLRGPQLKTWKEVASETSSVHSLQFFNTIS